MSETRALIADDHELFSWALQSLLRTDLSFDHVQLVSTFQDTLDALSTGVANDLLCLDLSMPGMNGFESVEVLKEAAPPDMLIVIVTASTRRDDVAEAIKTGVNGYILKTMRTPEISEALRTVLQGKVFIPPVLRRTGVSPLTERRGTNPAEETGAAGTVSGAEAPARHWSDLTARQKAVGELIVCGRSNKEIAITIGVAEGTVKVHVAALFRALSVRNRTEAVTKIMTMRSAAR